MKNKIWMIIFFAIFFSLLVSPACQAVSMPSSRKYNFDFDWIFSKGVGKENAGATESTKSAYDLVETDVVVIPSTETPYATTYEPGSAWQNVSLPHTYNDVDTFDNYTEVGMNGERSIYSGTAWYKKLLQFLIVGTVKKYILSSKLLGRRLMFI